MSEQKTKPEKTKEFQEVEELNLDAKVAVKSIANWETTFTRKVDGIGDVIIAPNGTMKFSRAEIIGQVQSGNKLFTGLDGAGSHATLYIDDKATRVEVEFESEDGKITQKVYSDDKVKELFEIKSFESFKDKFTDAIKTRAEKRAVIETIKRLKLNDYAKIRFIENYTGFRIG